MSNPKKTDLTQERLKQLLQYDPETGEFRWKKQRGAKQGAVAGCWDRKQQKIILDDCAYSAHHLVWFVETGRWPEKPIEFINGDRKDSRYSNLQYEQAADPMFSGDIDAQTLREILAYNPETGEFTWRISTKRGITKGQSAGSTLRNGYRVIRMPSHIKRNKLYMAHRLAWLHYYGEWPPNLLNHIDGCPQNNAIVNLRLATDQENAWNSSKPITNTSGVKGVSWSKKNKKWLAKITVKRQQKYLGLFTSKEDAASAYARAAKKYFGEFARTE